MSKKIKKLLRDLSIFIFSLLLAWYIFRSDQFSIFLNSLLPLRFLAEFLTGILYSFFFTSPLAVVSIVVLAKDGNPLLIAALGGLGSMVADLLIVKFFKQEAASDFSIIMKILGLNFVGKALRALHLDFIVTLIAAVIIASPLPDELGLALLSWARIEYKNIAFLSYILNAAGIFIIAMSAKVIGQNI